MTLKKRFKGQHQAVGAAGGRHFTGRSARRFVAAAAAVTLLGAAVAGCGSSASSSPSGNSPTRVGFIADETGTLAPLGTAYKRGFDAATALWNADRAHRAITTQACDSQSTGPGALGCYQRLKDSVDAISGPHLFLGIAAVKALAAPGTIPVMSAAPVAAPAADSELFQSVPTINDGVAAGLKYLKAQGLTRVALLTSNDVPGDAAATAAKKLAPASGVTLVDSEAFDPTSESLAAQAGNIAAAKPQAVLAWTAGPQLIIALRALRAAQLNVPVMLNYASMSVPLLTKAGSVAGSNLLFFATSAFAPASIKNAAYRDRVERFVAEYQRRYKSTPDFTAFVAADTANILGAAGAAAGGPGKIRKTLDRGTALDGVLFPLYKFSSDDHVMTGGAQLFNIMRWRPASHDWTIAG